MLTEKRVLGWYGIIVFFIVFAVALLSQVATAQGTSEVTYTLTGDVLKGPKTLEAGYHIFTLQNAGDKEADIVIVQFKKDTGANLVEEVQAVDKAFMEEGGNPSAAFRTVLEGRTLWGGAEAGPSESGSTGVNLPRGNYLILASIYSDEGPEAGPTVYVTKPLEVTGEAVAAPQADATVQMVDFAFAFPSDLKPGEQTWEFVNRGKQVHVAAIMKIKPGKTMDDVMKYAETFEGEDPTEEFGYVSMISPNVSNFVTLGLTKGTYVAVCWVPDYAVGGDGAPHFEHGMMQSFTVAGK